MFYSVDILSRKNRNGLGVIWLASTSRTSTCKRLTRKDYMSVNLPNACEYLVSPPEPLALRLSSNLMMGITRVYSHQCNYYYQDVQSVFTNLTKSYLVAAAGHKILLSAPQARAEAITLPEAGDGGAYLTLHDVTFDPEKIVGNMEVFGWANVKKAAMAAGSTNGSNLSSSSIPSPQSGVGLLISPLQGGLSSNTDISIGSDLLQQLHQDHLLAAGETRRRPPAAAHRLPSEGSFGLSSADPFDDEFNATMVFPSMPAQFSDNLQPAADCSLNSQPAFDDFPNPAAADDFINMGPPVNEFAIENVQDEIAHQAPKRRKLRHQITDQLIELNIKDFILTDTSSLRITSVQVFGVDDVKTPKQDLQFHFSHPFCKTLPKVLSDIWKSARNAVQDEPLPIQENSIIDDTLGDSGFGLGADFMDNNTVHDFSVEVMRGADLGDSFAAFRDSMTPVRANRSSLASRRPSLSSNGDLSSEAETANRDRLSLGPRLSDASFNLGGLIKPNDGGNASEDVDQQRRSQSFAEQVGLLASRQSRVQFHQLFSGNASRAEAADSFYQLLLLTQRGQLLVHQSQPYAPIDIQIVITAE